MATPTINQGVAAGLGVLGLGGSPGNTSSKTAGGTFLGNLVRAAASNLSGGILGQGKNKLNADGTYGNGDSAPWYTDLLATAAVLIGQTPQGQEAIAQSTGSYVAATTKNNWLWLGIIGLLAALLIFKRK
jgi:hypothetical protein